MFIGKWNKSVILTYVGMASSIIGMYIACTTPSIIKYSLICFIIAGVCDMFDGFVARKCKRTEEEKNFGIQLDSLVDVVSFVVFPIIIMIQMGLTSWYSLIFYCMYAICGVARLGYFNIIAESNPNEPVKYYTGLPVTVSVIVYGLFYPLKLIISESLFNLLFSFLPLIVAVLFISKIKVMKPKKTGYIVLSSIAIIMLFVYIFVL